MTGYVKTYVIDVDMFRTPEECAHSLRRLNRLLIVIVIKVFVKMYVIDMDMSCTPEADAHSLNWPNGHMILITIEDKKKREGIQYTS